jgi:quercetin dioxygenase-like cupin family protein
MDVTIVPIPDSSQALLASAAGWNETPVPSGKRVARHFHDFQAIYFTFGIPTMQVGDEQRSLPEAAMVVVPKGVVHGWLGRQDKLDAMVGHFHEGHGYHFMENVDDSIVLTQ